MTDPTLHSLDATTPFADRHIGLRADDVTTMLERIGYASVEDLMAAAVPSAIRSGVLELPAAVSEHGAAAELRTLAEEAAARARGDLDGEGDRTHRGSRGHLHAPRTRRRRRW